jgi:hypothetical protein
MKHCIILITGILLLAGCHGAKPTMQNITVQTGPRFDDYGEFTDAPEVSILVWNSRGLKEKPEDLRPE